MSRHSTGALSPPVEEQPIAPVSSIDTGRTWVYTTRAARETTQVVNWAAMKTLWDIVRRYRDEPDNHEK